MTDTDLTAPEAVERLARHTEAACKCEFGDLNVSATLRALSAERDEALNQLGSARHSVDVLERRVADMLARSEAAEAKLKEALRMGKIMSLFINGDSTQRGVQAAYDFRAFIASIEGDKP